MDVWRAILAAHGQWTLEVWRRMLQERLANVHYTRDHCLTVYLRDRGRPLVRYLPKACQRMHLIKCTRLQAHL